MINTLIRDNLKIIKTIDFEESIYILKLIYQKTIKQPDIFSKKLLITLLKNIHQVTILL